MCAENRKCRIKVFCLIHRNDNYLLQNRLKDDWKDLTLPGGHIEKMNLSKMNTVNDLPPLLQVMEDDNLTDMVRKIDNGPALIEKWPHNKNTIEFLGIWEEMYNTDFNVPPMKKSCWRQFKPFYYVG